MQQPLSSAEIDDGLQQLQGWALDAQRRSIHKAWKFNAFKTAMNFFAHVGELAEALDHHPEFVSNYTMVTIRLTTHDASGLTHQDFELALQIDQLVNRAFSDLLEID